MKKSLAIVAFSVLLAAAGCSTSGTTGANADQKRAQGGMHLTMTDQQFIASAGEGGAYEVQAGELAQNKAADANVRSMAHHMVEDHKKANTDLAGLASRKGVTMPVSPSSDQDKMVAQLNQLSGTDFDREYLRQQKQAHVDTIALFEGEAANGSDNDLRTFASETLPTLRSHLEMVEGRMNTAANQQEIVAFEMRGDREG